MTFDCTGRTKQCFLDPKDHYHGARYLQRLSPVFPYFEVSFVNSKKDFTLTVYMGC